MRDDPVIFFLFLQIFQICPIADHFLSDKNTPCANGRSSRLRYIRMRCMRSTQCRVGGVAYMTGFRNCTWESVHGGRPLKVAVIERPGFSLECCRVLVSWFKQTACDFTTKGLRIFNRELQSNSEWQDGEKSFNRMRSAQFVLWNWTPFLLYVLYKHQWVLCDVL